MRLNLASGTDLRDGWLNLDIVPKWPIAARGCDVVWDARKDRIPFADGSVDEVYAGYLLLHLAPCYHGFVLEEIRRVLKPGGLARFGEVDMEIVMGRFLKNPLDPHAAELIWGEQGNVHGSDLAEFDKHCHGFTEESLRATLYIAGFKDFRRVSIHSPDVFYELTIECTV